MPHKSLSTHSRHPTSLSTSPSIVARWEDLEYEVNLVRSGYQSTYALVMNSKRLDKLAQAAITEAGRLDSIEAPQQALDAKTKAEAERRVVLERARQVNQPNFRP